MPHYGKWLYHPEGARRWHVWRHSRPTRVRRKTRLEKTVHAFRFIGQIGSYYTQTNLHHSSPRIGRRLTPFWRCGSGHEIKPGRKGDFSDPNRGQQGPDWRSSKCRSPIGSESGGRRVCTIASHGGRSLDKISLCGLLHSTHSQVFQARVREELPQ